MENSKVKMQTFFITVKRVGKRLPRMSDYESYFSRLLKVREFLELIGMIYDVYEVDSHKRIHYHGLYVVDTSVKFTESEIYDVFNVFKTNWHINVRECFTEEDVNSCLRYMRKDEVKKFREEILEGKYMFQDGPSNEKSSKCFPTNANPDHKIQLQYPAQ